MCRTILPQSEAIKKVQGQSPWSGVRAVRPFYCVRGRLIIYNRAMPKRQIGVEVLIEDHLWSEAQSQYVYSFHCPACSQLRLIPDLGIYRCDCGSWLIVTNQR